MNNAASDTAQDPAIEFGQLRRAFGWRCHPHTQRNRGTIDRDGDRQGALAMHELKRGIGTFGHHHVDDSLRSTFAEASAITRVIAELSATRLDKQLVAGLAPRPASALAAHVARLASP